MNKKTEFVILGIIAVSAFLCFFCVDKCLATEINSMSISSNTNTTITVPNQDFEQNVVKIDFNDNSVLFQNGDKSKDDNADTEKFLAIITFSKGRNKVFRKDGTLDKCKVDLTLFEGDKIVVSKSGKVSIVYKKSGIYYALKPEETLIISVSDEAEKQKIDLSKVNEAIVKNINSNDGKPILSAVAGTRERKDPNHPFPISPRNTHLFHADKVLFTWETPDGLNLNDAETKDKVLYKLHLFFEGKEIGTFTTESTSIALEIEKVGIKPGILYYWYVERTDMPRVAQVKPFFKVIPVEESDKIKKLLESIEKLKTDDQDGTCLVLTSRILLENSLFQDALEKLVKCYKMTPGDEGLLESIDRIYKAMGFFPDDIERFVNKLKDKYPTDESDNNEKPVDGEQQTKPK